MLHHIVSIPKFGTSGSPESFRKREMSASDLDYLHSKGSCTQRGHVDPPGSRHSAASAELWRLFALFAARRCDGCLYLCGIRSLAPLGSILAPFGSALAPLGQP